MALRLYNTLSQQVEPFSPADGQTVRMYTCGPTVYDFAHIGNFRTFVVFDLLRRCIRLNGFRLDHVMNITDVDDKIIRGAIAKNQDLDTFTAPYIAAFLEDCSALRLERPERLVRATQHIIEMADAIETLNRKGFTYTSEGSTYFKIASFPEYGKLSHNDFSGMRSGARVDVDSYDKADARDFALWKLAKENEPAWEIPAGRGRPGWHLECSVMAMKYLGDTLDLHAGGIDLTFPHHENEIAQSEALSGHIFSRFWVHSEFLSVEGQKMSKSLGNYFTLRDILGKGYSPESVRYLLASVPYRKGLNFTFDGLKSAATSIERLRNYKLRLETAKFPEGEPLLGARTAEAHEQFRAALDDDMNTAEALATVFEYVRETNIAMDQGEFRQSDAALATGLLEAFDAIFEVLKPSVAEGAMSDQAIEEAIAARNHARKTKDFSGADRIRHQLLDAGVILEDTRDGVRWKRK